MRLKILFFPLMLLASISFFIGFVWPEIEKAKGLYAENKKSTETIELINKKKDNAKSLDQNMGANKDKEDFIVEYVPKQRKEEKIIDMINVFASENVLTLSNVTVEVDKESLLAEEEEEIENSAIKSVFARNTPVEGGGLDDPAIEGKFQPSVNVRKISFSANVIGKYENIKNFLGSIEKADMINDIVSVSISSQENGQSGGSEASQSEDLLSAEVVIDFYYFRGIRWNGDYNNAIFDKSELDFSEFNKVKEFISREMLKMEILEKGKANPFL